MSVTVGSLGALTLPEPGAALRRWSLRLGLVFGIAIAVASGGGGGGVFDLF